MPKMKYVGKGKWLRGVPKRDLSIEEVKRCGGVAALEKTGLYEAVRRKKTIKVVAETKGYIVLDGGFVEVPENE